jgi:membrane protease YdiL (CAAX protease family)
MSPRLDLPIALAAWLLGFAWIGLTGSWTLLVLLAVLAAGRLVAGDPATRRLLRLDGRAAGLGLAGGGAMVAATYAGHGLLAGAFPPFAGATRGLYALLNAEGYRPPALAALILLVATCEEVIWRGRALEPAGGSGARLSGPALARAAAAAALYGAATLASGSLLLGALALACGLAWGLLRTAGRSLWPAILAHATWDLAVLVVWPLT